MISEHIVGLAAAEYMQGDGSSVCQRFEQIKAHGALLPATARNIGDASNSFALDFLAGDNQYVFLSAGPRYRVERPAHLCYGFLFDAEDLIRNHSALVGPDLGPAYEEILDAVVREVDASLPPLAEISDEELSEFAETMGITDPAVLAHLRKESTSRYHDLIAAVTDSDLTVEGASHAIEMFKSEVKKIQKSSRLRGEVAIAGLAEGMEILVPISLAIALAVGTVEGGKVIQ